MVQSQEQQTLRTTALGPIGLCDCVGQERLPHPFSHLSLFPQQNGWLLMSPTTRAIWKVLLSPSPPWWGCPCLPTLALNFCMGLIQRPWAC